MKTFGGSSGFTYIEVLLAAAILAVGAVVSARVGVSNSQSLSDETHAVMAFEISSNVMEDLMSRSPADPYLTAGQHVLYFDQNELQVAGPSVFKATWLVNAGSPIATMLDVQLQVSWSISGSTKSVSLETYRSAQ